jgi:hypothetical protein
MTMKNLTIPPQSKPKSILDMTPGELAEIDACQDHNRGFKDDGEEDLENYFDLSYED